LDQLAKSKYYTTLDLAQGCHQVLMSAPDWEKTAFSTDKGHYECHLGTKVHQEPFND